MRIPPLRGPSGGFRRYAVRAAEFTVTRSERRNPPLRGLSGGFRRYAVRAAEFTVTRSERRNPRLRGPSGGIRACGWRHCQLSTARGFRPTCRAERMRENEDGRIFTRKRRLRAAGPRPAFAHERSDTRPHTQNFRHSPAPNAAHARASARSFDAECRAFVAEYSSIRRRMPRIRGRVLKHSTPNKLARRRMPRIRDRVLKHSWPSTQAFAHEYSIIQRRTKIARRRTPRIRARVVDHSTPIKNCSTSL